MLKKHSPDNKNDNPAEQLINKSLCGFYTTTFNELKKLTTKYNDFLKRADKIEEAIKKNHQTSSAETLLMHQLVPKNTLFNPITLDKYVNNLTNDIKNLYIKIESAIKNINEINKINSGDEKFTSILSVEEVIKVDEAKTIIKEKKYELTSLRESIEPFMKQQNELKIQQKIQGLKTVIDKYNRTLSNPVATMRNHEKNPQFHITPNNYKTCIYALQHYNRGYYTEINRFIENNKPLITQIKKDKNNPHFNIIGEAEHIINPKNHKIKHGSLPRICRESAKQYENPNKDSTLLYAKNKMICNIS